MTTDVLNIPVDKDCTKAMVKTKLLTIFFLGFSSGLPFLLILSTFSVWLAELHVSKTKIGVLAWITIPYTCKFILAPFVDRIRLPLLYKYLGQRKSWMLMSQIALIIFLSRLGCSEPDKNLLLSAVMAFMVGLFSAIQDIAIEAYRIESLDEKNLGKGASISVLGYRLGMLCSGACTIYIAAYFKSWAVAYNIIAGCMLIGIVVTLIAIEPQEVVYPEEHKNFTKEWFVDIVISPLKSFFLNPQWKTIIIFILCYKFADTTFNVMSMPFLIELGFNKVEIAHVAKTFGIIAMVCGGISGGILLDIYGLKNLLFLTAILQFIAAILFVEQSIIGYNVLFLFVTMGIENFTCGLAQVALISYLSALCTKQYTASHYAILSSLASFVRVCFSMFAGWLADILIWRHFYSIVCLSCILTIIVLIMSSKHFTRYNKTIEVLT